MKTSSFSLRSVLLFLLLSLVTRHSSLVTAASAAPLLVCDAPSFDSGPVPASPLTHEYILRNDGDLPLEIKNARASDGNFRLTPPSRPIPPGESAPLRAIFTPSRRSGPHTGRIILSSNDPENPVFFLSFRCDVIQPPSATPSFLRFGRVTSSDASTRRITITADHPFAVHSATTAHPDYAIEIDSSDPATSHTLSISVLPSMSPGPFGDTLTVELDLPVHPLLHIPLIGDWHPAPPSSATNAPTSPTP